MLRRALLALPEAVLNQRKACDSSLAADRARRRPSLPLTTMPSGWEDFSARVAGSCLSCGVQVVFIRSSSRCGARNRAVSGSLSQAKSLSAAR